MLKEIKFFISVVSLVSLVSLVDIADSANNTPVHLCGLDWKVVGNKFHCRDRTNSKITRTCGACSTRGMLSPGHHVVPVALSSYTYRSGDQWFTQAADSKYDGGTASYGELTFANNLIDGEESPDSYNQDVY